MGSLAVIPLMGFLGILFITLNLIVIALIILTIVFGIIRIIKKKFKKTVIVLLVVTIVLCAVDFKIIYNFTHYDEIEKQKLVQEEGKELVAIMDYDYNKVKEYLDSGWNPNETTKAVYYAIKYNPDESKEKDEWSILELLLQNGANPDVQIFDEPTGVNTPLTFTTECGYYGATKLLLEYGADVNFQENRFGDTPIHSLRYYNNDKAAEILELLLEYNPNLDIESNSGESVKECLENFEKDYSRVKDKVPDYDEVQEIIYETI